MQSIYLDNAATTALDPAVITAINQANREYFANPSSIHQAGQKSKVALENARQQMAEIIGAQREEIIFTSGGTESDNIALISTALAYRQQGRHILISRTEHQAILEAARYLEKLGFTISYINVSTEGDLDIDQFQSLLAEDTILISVMLANNETGAISPVGQISEIITGRNIIIHSDAVQAFGKMDVNVNTLGVDLLSLSAHKIYGPKGVGALYVKRGTKLNPLSFGGSQEHRRRAGTENLPGIIGFAEAANQLTVQKSERSRIQALRERFETEIINSIPGTRINGRVNNRLISISSIYFPQIKADSLLMNLDMNGIAVSAGSACSSGLHALSHVLSAMKLPIERIQNTVRFSFGRFNTEEEVDQTVRVLKRILKV